MALMEDKIEAYISEFVGTFFLVLTIGFNVLQNTALAPISIGAILMAMIFATGKVSGGHFNPAVTLGVYCRGKMDGGLAWGYVFTQLAAGLVAGCMYVSILGSSFTLGPGLGYSLASACLVEVLFTTALVFVVLSVATTTQDADNWYFGLAIGFTVMAAAFAIGPISGCCLNPAVALGVMLSSFLHTGYLRVSYLLLYMITPCIGAFIAVLLFQLIRRAEYKLNVSNSPRKLDVDFEPEDYSHHHHHHVPAQAFAVPSYGSVPPSELPLSQKSPTHSSRPLPPRREMTFCQSPILIDRV